MQGPNLKNNTHNLVQHYKTMFDLSMKHNIGNAKIQLIYYGSKYDKWKKPRP